MFLLLGQSTILLTYYMIFCQILLLILSIIITFYVLFGGIKGVMYTDALQGTIMVLAMVFLLVFVYWSVIVPAATFIFVIPEYF